MLDLILSLIPKSKLLKKALKSYANVQEADSALAAAEVGESVALDLPGDLQIDFKSRGGKRFSARQIVVVREA